MAKYIAKLFYEGHVRKAVALQQACTDLNGQFPLKNVSKLFDVPAAGLMARIRRYTDGRNLVIPEQLNQEKFPFWAIKYAFCDDWEAFNKQQNPNPADLQHLRAYFWNELNPSKELMCITHFWLKTQAKLHPADTAISHRERDEFYRNGCDYEED